MVGAEREIGTLIKLLMERPPRTMLTDQRYWDWDRRVDEALMLYEAATGSTPEGAA